MSDSLHPVTEFLRIRPATITDLVRFSIALVSGLIFKISGLKRVSPQIGNASPGVFVPYKLKPLVVRNDGLLITTRPSELWMLTGVYEPRTVSWLRPRMGETVVDVGAHIGFYTITAARAGARVIAVEPDSSNFGILLHNVSRNGFLSTVTLVPAALSDRNGRKKLYTSIGGNALLSSLDHDWLPESQGKINSTIIDCLTLDQLIEDNAIKTIDWLKVDVESHQLHVLEGGRNALALTNHLIIEVTTDNSDECLKLVRAAGLRVIAVENIGRDPHGKSAMYNWFCVR